MTDKSKMTKKEKVAFLTNLDELVRLTIRGDTGEIRTRCFLKLTNLLLDNMTVANLLITQMSAVTEYLMLDGRGEEVEAFLNFLIKGVEQKQIYHFEVLEDEKEVLDLSKHTTKEDECLDLAKHISAILKSDLKPSIAVAIMDAIQTENPEMTHFTVENLSKVLCAEVENE